MLDAQTSMTIGLDLGDQWSRFAVLDATGELVGEGRVRTTPGALKQRFGRVAPAVVVLEVGPQSAWISELFAELGHSVLVANPREVKAVTGSTRKCDREDARVLARLARVDASLLHPIRHRGEEARAGLLAVRSRAALVEARTQTDQLRARSCENVRGESPGMWHCKLRCACASGFAIGVMHNTLGPACGGRGAHA